MASGDILRIRGTTRVFTASGGDVTFTLTNLAAGAGRRSPSFDFGANVDELEIKFGGDGFETAPALGEKVRLFAIKYGNAGSATDGTNDDGNADGAVSAIDKLVNLEEIHCLSADEAAADIPMFKEGCFKLGARHIAFAVWNYSAGDNLQNTANTWEVKVTPITYQVQA